jgi:hypothetical protein
VALLKLPTMLRKLKITELKTIHDLKADEIPGA